MNTSPFAARPLRPVHPGAFADLDGDTQEVDALIDDASDAELELALKLVAWNARDVGQFLKQHRVA